MSTAAPSPRWRHDLQNQIGIVMGYSEILLDSIGNDAQLRADVQEIMKAARRAMELVRELNSPAE